MATLLTKSTLLSAAQCPRKLWLEVRRPDLVPDKDVAADRRKREGIQVGELARSLLGPGILWPKSQASKEESAVAAAHQLRAAPEATAVEVPLYFEDVYARADVLVPTGTGGYVLSETKATTFPLKTDKVTPGKPDDEHVLDLAIQAWVLTNSGFKLERAELNLVNSRWRYAGDGAYAGLFRKMDVTADVLEVAAHLPDLVASARATLAAPMPEVRMGKQCKNPHSCQYASVCEALAPPAPKHPIELMPDAAGKKLAQKLKTEKGYTSLLEPATTEFVGAAAGLYIRMQAAHRSGLAYHSAQSGEQLDTLPYPRYYFDFEGIDLAVPIWAGIRPYEQVPFQWSCHIERAPGIFELGEFLDLSGNDPSLACIEQMLKTIALDDNGPIFVYFATYERGRLQELALRHPEHAAELETYISRLVDLLPVVKTHFYHPLMAGSFSIKKVLPVIAPDLDYAELTEVSDGVAAQLAYIKAALSGLQTPAEKALTEANSRIYCRQDTWAMVEVAYFLAHAARPVRPVGM